MQQIAELLLTNPMGFGIKDLLEENVGDEANRFIAFTGSVSIFILFSNLLSLFPALRSPTGAAIVPLGCALLTFLYFNYQGFRHHGIGGYLKTFAGSPHDISGWILAVLLFPVEIISTTARILSLTVRLWANIFASDLIYMIFLGLLLGPVEWAWTKSPILGIAFGIFPALRTYRFCGAAYLCIGDSGVCLHRAAVHLYRDGDCRRALNFSFFDLPLQRETGCSAQSREPPTGGMFKEAVMKKAVMLLAALVAVMIVAPAAFGQDTAVAGKGTLAIAAGFGMALAAFGGALGQGKVASSACEGMARNPGAAGAIRAAMILGLVFIETLSLFTLAIIMLKV